MDTDCSMASSDGCSVAAMPLFQQVSNSVRCRIEAQSARAGGKDSPAVAAFAATVRVISDAEVVAKPDRIHIGFILVCDG